MQIRWIIIILFLNLCPIQNTSVFIQYVQYNFDLMIAECRNYCIIIDVMRAWFSGKTAPCQGAVESSILSARTNNERSEYILRGRVLCGAQYGENRTPERDPCEYARVRGGAQTNLFDGKDLVAGDSLGTQS